MADYIKREDAVKAIRLIRKCVKLFEDSVEDVAVALNDLAQSADVTERKVGRWEDVLFGWTCSCCGQEQDYSFLFCYCPNCGAKMEE